MKKLSFRAVWAYVSVNAFCIVDTIAIRKPDTGQKITYDYDLENQ